MDLECGHRMEWVPVKAGRPPLTKHCPKCHVIIEFAKNKAGLFRNLHEHAMNVPLEDRSVVLFNWIEHIHRADEYVRRIPGLDAETALLMAERQSYPFPMNGDYPHEYQ